MATRFVLIDRDTPLLLPPNLRDWVPADHLVHFILDAVEALDLRQVKVNTRGTGSEQYPPPMLLGLLIYSYATGTFGSRRIEQSTYDSVPVRLLTADTHPDHDTLCTFRRENPALLTESFVKVLQLAQQLKVLKFGQLTVAADGTKVLANASKHSAVSCQSATRREGGRPTPQGSDAQAPARRPIQLHRPREPDHESGQWEPLRAELQRAGCRGRREPANRGPARQPSPQRQTGTGADVGGHSHRGGNARRGPGRQRFLQ